MYLAEWGACVCPQCAKLAVYFGSGGRRKANKKFCDVEVLELDLLREVYGSKQKTVTKKKKKKNNKKEEFPSSISRSFFMRLKKLLDYAHETETIPDH